MATNKEVRYLYTKAKINYYNYYYFVKLKGQEHFSHIVFFYLFAHHLYKKELKHQSLNGSEILLSSTQNSVKYYVMCG